jgi:hypothetical protein
VAGAPKGLLRAIPQHRLGQWLRRNKKEVTAASCVDVVEAVLSGGVEAEDAVAATEALIEVGGGACLQRQGSSVYAVSMQCPCSVHAASMQHPCRLVQDGMADLVAVCVANTVPRIPVDARLCWCAQRLLWVISLGGAGTVDCSGQGSMLGPATCNCQLDRRLGVAWGTRLLCQVVQNWRGRPQMDDVPAAGQTWHGCVWAGHTSFPISTLELFSGLHAG